MPLRRRLRKAIAAVLWTMAGVAVLAGVVDTLFDHRPRVARALGLRVAALDTATVQAALHARFRDGSPSATLKRFATALAGSCSQ